jgi:hypothetical protein
MSDEKTEKPGAQIVPIHSATATERPTVKRGKGRPKKVVLKPSREDLEYHAEMAQERERFVDLDAVVQDCKDGKDTLERLRSLQLQMAREAAALQFTRLEQEKYGKETAQISTRRLNALKLVADIELEIKKLGTNVLDLHSEKVQKLFQLWIEFIKEAASPLPPEQSDLFFNRLENLMSDWEEKASEVLR